MKKYLIFILIIILIFVASTRCETMESKPKRGIFIMAGGSFRNGSQGNTRRGEEISYEQQINACQSHIKLFKHIKEKYNCDSDVVISTYNTQYNEDLFNTYGSHLVGKYTRDDEIGIKGLFQNGAKVVDISSYDFLCYIRIDLFLKDKFIEIFNPTWNIIHYPFICWKKDSVENGKPRVCDLITYIPKRFFYVVPSMTVAHDEWLNFANNFNIDVDDMNVMINTYHDSDSEKDNNPLYYIVNRPETDKWDSEGEIFDKYHFTLTPRNL